MPEQWKPLRDIIKFDGVRRYYWTHETGFADQEPIRLANVYETDTQELWAGQLDVPAIELFPPEWKTPMTLLERLDAESDWTIAGLAAAEIRELQSSLSTLKARVRKVIEQAYREGWRVNAIQLTDAEYDAVYIQRCEDHDWLKSRAARALDNELKEE